MKVEIVKDMPVGMSNSKAEKVYKVIKDLYESDNTCIKVTDEEHEFKSVTALRNLLNEQGKNYSEYVLRSHGIRKFQLSRYGVAYRLTAFSVRKENCKGNIYVKVDRYTEEEINDLRRKLEEAQKRVAERIAMREKQRTVKE